MGRTRGRPLIFEKGSILDVFGGWDFKEVRPFEFKLQFEAIKDFQRGRTRDLHFFHELNKNLLSKLISTDVQGIESKENILFGAFRRECDAYRILYVVFVDADDFGWGDPEGVFRGSCDVVCLGSNSAFIRHFLKELIPAWGRFYINCLIQS